MSELNVSCIAFQIQSNPSWIMDSGAIDYVTKEQETFIEFQRLIDEVRWIFVENNVRIKIQDIITCTPVLRDHCILISTITFLMLQIFMEIWFLSLS